MQQNDCDDSERKADDEVGSHKENTLNSRVSQSPHFWIQSSYRPMIERAI